MVVLACVGTIGCSSQTPLTLRERAVIEQTLTDQIKSWERAWNNADTDSLSALYVQSPELTVVWVDGSVRRGWEEEQLAQVSLFNSTERVNFIVRNPVERAISRNVAVSTFSPSIDVVRLGGRREMLRSGSGTVLWVRDEEDAMWRIQLAHLSVTPSATN